MFYLRLPSTPTRRKPRIYKLEGTQILSTPLEPDELREIKHPEAIDVYSLSLEKMLDYVAELEEKTRRIETTEEIIRIRASKGPRKALKKLVSELKASGTLKR